MFIPLALAILSGCLSNSYSVRRDELARLSTLDPGERWQSVRAVQRIGADDEPPHDTVWAAPEPSPGGGVYIQTVVVNSHRYDWPPPLRAPRAPAKVAAAPTSPANGSVGGGPATLGGTAHKGKGDPAAAILVAAAVVVGAASGVALAATEGARYDGWIAVNPDEPVYLELESGHTRAVALSQVTPSDLAGVERATLYEGSEDRFPKLGRAPLDRVGFTMGTALHVGGVPQIDRSTATGVGGYLHLGGNIANRVTFGLSATVDGGADARPSVLLATVTPEVDVFPLRYFGLYGAAGWAFRNTSAPYGETRADESWVLRGGALAELPLSTRLALQFRVGAAQYFFENRSLPFAEGQLGFAIY